MKATILSKEVLYKKWGEYALYTIAYTRTDGIVEEQKREMQHSGNGAAVLLYNVERKTVLLVQQFRLAALLTGHDTGVLTEVCAGLVEQDDPTYTIIKEIKEELGLTVHNVSYHFSAYATPGAKTEKISFFTAPYDKLPIDLKQGLASEQEDIIVLELPFDEAYEGITNGSIVDAKTIILLQFAKINLF